MVFDMQGVLKETINLSNINGKGEVVFSANQFKPGMYLYSLIVDKKEIDTKRMIIIE